MSDRPELETRVRAYLARGAARRVPAEMDDRILAGVRPQRLTWTVQVVTAFAVLFLAIGLGIAAHWARQLNPNRPAGGGPVVTTATASPEVSPSGSAKPTVGPSLPAGNAGYPLLAPASIRIIDASTGWAAGAGTDRILRTTDGGAHWADVTPTDARRGQWTTYFLDADHAWLASSLEPGGSSGDFSVKLYRTSNGGRIWQAVPDLSLVQEWPAGLDFVDLAHGFMFVRSGPASLADPARSDDVAVYGTTDGGLSWAKLSEADSGRVAGHLPVDCSKSAPTFMNSASGWITGGCPDGAGLFFYETRDGGRSWNPASITMPAGVTRSACTCRIESLRVVDAKDGYLVLTIYARDGQSQSYLYASHDRGGSWVLGPTLPVSSIGAYFVDQAHGWTLNGKSNEILATVDGGNHWATMGHIPSKQGVLDYQFASARVGWALGSEAGDTIIKTSDGGATWELQLQP